MLFHRKCIKTDNLKLTIGQGTPKQTSQCKYLGLIIDNKLNWAANIAHVKSKTSKCVGILLKARPSLTSLFAIHKNDIQKTWIVINNTLNNNSRNSIQSEFIVNNNKLGILLMPSTIISLTSDASFQIKFNLLIIIVTIYITRLNHTFNSNPSVKLISVIQSII